MQSLNRQLHVFAVNQYGYLDFGRRNYLNVDPFVAQRAKHRGRNAGLASHTDPDRRDLGNVCVGDQKKDEVLFKMLLLRLGEDTTLAT